MKEHPKLRSPRLHFSPTNTKCSKCNQMRASRLGLTDTTIVNQLNQLGRVISEDEMVKRLLRSLPKSWRSTVVAIREGKDLNKISLDEICGSLLTYEQEVNQIDEEEKKELVEKKKGIALKTSSRSEEHYEDSCEDEDAEMAMLARRYKNCSRRMCPRSGSIGEDTRSLCGSA